MASGPPRVPDERSRRLAQRVLARCEAVAACTEEPGRITRPFPSPAMTDAQHRVADWMREAGLDVRTDPIGNVVGRKRAGRDDAPVLLLGSHLDSVGNAGRYDGVLGVLVALEVAGAAPEDLPFHLDVIAFCDEEGLRFGATYFGSRAVTGAFQEATLDVTDADGISLRDALRQAGYDPAAIDRAAYDRDRVLGYVELHIEQGPQLERADAPLGIATGIAGQTKLTATFEGEAAHAGTSPMQGRRDALAGAAEWVLAVESRGRQTPGLVATVGRVQAEPGALNVVAGRASATLDVRHEQDAERISAAADLRSAATEIARRRGLAVAFEVHEESAATPLDQDLVRHFEALTGAPRLVSGAGHDASVMSRFAPSALLFIRSPGGVSHHPDEAVLADDVAWAISAQLQLVERLAEGRA